ncbi:MAG: HAD family acid phosphatase [Candidatus Neomarinimicrobiota bacterium]
MKLISSLIIIFIFTCSFPFGQVGKLRVGFDIDDTVLHSESGFVVAPRNAEGKVDYSWINTHDKDYSVFIEPVVTLIDFFRAHGHEIYFITARPGINGEHVAEYLSEHLGFAVRKGENLIFSPKETVGDFRYTTKHKIMLKLDLDIYYGDSDTDMIAAIKADVHGVRIIRSDLSIAEYGSNYFGNTLKPGNPESPFSREDINLFYQTGVGIFGESIYPITWSVAEPGS